MMTNQEVTRWSLARDCGGFPRADTISDRSRIGSTSFKRIRKRKRKQSTTALVCCGGQVGQIMANLRSSSNDEQPHDSFRWLIRAPKLSCRKQEGEEKEVLKKATPNANESQQSTTTTFCLDNKQLFRAPSPSLKLTVWTLLLSLIIHQLPVSCYRPSMESPARRGEALDQSGGQSAISIDYTEADRMVDLSSLHNGPNTGEQAYKGTNLLANPNGAQLGDHIRPHLAAERLSKRSMGPAKPPDVDSTRVVAVSGQWIEFQCPLAGELLTLSSSGSGNSKKTRPGHSIIWLKDGVQVNQMNPRLRSYPNNGSLVIVAAQPKLDEATYECRLIAEAAEDDQERGASEQAPNHNVQKPLKAHKFQLRLLIPPRLAPFEFPQDAQVGMKVVLTCSALEGHQPISFVWLKDNQIIDSSGQATAGPTTGSDAAHQTGVVQGAKPLSSSLGQLHRRQLADKSLGQVELSPAQRSSEYVVLMTSGAAKRTVGAGSAADELDVAELNDNVDQLAAGAASPSSTLSDASIRVRQADDYSILSIDPLELKHSARYTCSAQNEAARVAHSSQLQINAPPSLLVEPRDGDLVSGQSTLIECQASGQPRPSISWSRARANPETSGKQWDFVPIYDNLRYSIHPNGSLSISNATQRDQGYYMCAAKNGFGPEVTKLIRITVHEPARIGVKYKTLEARIDERALMTCSASGEQPLALQWFDKEAKLIDKSDKRFIIDDGDLSASSPPTAAPSNSSEQSHQPPPTAPTARAVNITESRLIIARTTRPDSGHYTCQATNKHGSDKMAINLLVQDVPDKVAELKVTNVTSTTMSLRWQLAFAGNSPVGSYLVQYQSDDPLDDLLMSVTRSMSGKSSGAGDDTIMSSPLMPLISNLIDQQQQQQQPPPPQQQSPLTNPTASLKAALEALSVASATADEAIDRTLVELTVEQSATSLVVKDLSPFCVYRLRLAAINKIGLGEFSEWIRAKTEEAPPSGSALKISAAATGPNSIKLTWFPPDRRAWNGQLVRFNIGYRPIDSAFEFNKTLEWSPPSLQSIMLATDGERKRAGSGATSVSSSSSTRRPAQQPQEASSSSPYLLRQHLRQLLALQQQELVAHLTNLQRSTTYLVWIQAVNNRGSGPQSHAITVKTLDDVPPSAPTIRIQSTSTNSISIAWSMLSNFVSSANQYSLFYRRVAPPSPVSQSPSASAPVQSPITSSSMTGQTGRQQRANDSSQQQDLQDATSLAYFHEPGPFIERTISSQQLLMSSANSLQEQVDLMQQDTKQQSYLQQHQQGQHYQQFVYTLDQLDCGSVYELYMTTRNSVGKSEPSQVVTTRTRGEPPLAPADKNALFSRIGPSDVLLNLATWATGGCPMTHITVRYKLAPAPTAAASAATTNSHLNLSGQAAAAAAAASASSRGWPISTSVPANLLVNINNPSQATGTYSSKGSPAHLLAGDVALSQHNFEHPGQRAQAPFSLKNLLPSTGYELEIIAYNAAGHTMAQYEFVTAGLNGSRSGYTRRDGVYRLDQRGQPLLDSNLLSEQQGNQFGPDFSNTSLVGQLLPLALTVLCFVCLIISSTFCYYRLTDTWKRQRRRGGSLDDGQPPVNLSPGSTVDTSKSAFNCARANNSNNHRHHHLQHQATFGRQLASHNDLDDQSSSSSPPANHVHYCTRDLSPNQVHQMQQQQLLSATLNPKSSAGFSQSVSMKDFNLVPSPMGVASTLNFKPNCAQRSSMASTAPRMLSLQKGNTLCGRLYATNREDEMMTTSTDEQQPQVVGYGNINLDCPAYATNCKSGPQRLVAVRPPNGVYATSAYDHSPTACYSDHHHETSWTSTSGHHSMGATTNGTTTTTGNASNGGPAGTYAIPTSAAYQAAGEAQCEEGQPMYGQQEAQQTYGQTSIDACIQQLIGQHYQPRPENNPNGQQQQYAAILANGGQQLKQLGYAGGNLDYAGQPMEGLPLNQQQDVQSNLTGQSVIDSSSSSSGIGTSTISGTGGQHHLDCGVSRATSTKEAYQMVSMANNNYGQQQQHQQQQQQQQVFNGCEQQKSIELKQM